MLVLEYLLSYSKHNYDALLILVRLYMYLGMGSMAIDRYARLSIKNIQHATLSWILIDRLSTIHPWPCKTTSAGHVTFDPLEELQQALDWHQTSTILTDKALNRMMGRKQWGLAIGILRTQDALQNGLGRAMLNLELLKTQRLREGPHDKFKRIPLALPRFIQDNRDRTAFPNYEPLHQYNFEELLPTTSLSAGPNFKRLLQEYGQAQLWDRLEGREWSHMEMEQLENLANHSPAESDESSTKPDLYSSNILNFFTPLLPGPGVHSGLVLPQDILSQLERLIEKVVLMHKTAATRLKPGFGTLLFSDDCRLPLWTSLHNAFTMIETTRIVIRGMKQCMTDNRVLESGRRTDLIERISTIETLSKDIQEIVRSSARAWRKDIVSFDFETFLRSGDKGTGQYGKRSDEELCSIMGPEIFGSICTMFRESYIDAFDGVIRSTNL